MVICGVLLVFNPFKGAVFLTRVVGIFILVYAILDLVSTFVIKNTLDNIQKELKANIPDAKVIEEKPKKKEKNKKEKKNKKSKEQEEPKQITDKEEQEDKEEKEGEE